MASETGANAKIPNPALKPFERLIGEWKTTGTHPAIPDPLHGQASFQWEEGGAFLVWRSHVDHPQFPDGISIIASDDAAATFFISYFDERGISRKYDVMVTADGFTMHRLEPKFSQRMTFTVNPHDNRIEGRGEMSREGGPWEGDLSLTYERLSWPVTSNDSES
jgi:hypothetical protein